MRAVSRRAVALATVAAAFAAAAPAGAQAPDNTAPALAAATLDPSAFTGMRSSWYRGPVKLALAATDDVAVTKLQYSLDNGATWIDLPITAGPSVSGVATITQEGSTTARYRASHAAGTVSTPPATQPATPPPARRLRPRAPHAAPPARPAHRRSGSPARTGAPRVTSSR